MSILLKLIPKPHTEKAIENCNNNLIKGLILNKSSTNPIKKNSIDAKKIT